MMPIPSLLADAVYDRLTQQARVIVDTRVTHPRDRTTRTSR